MNINLFATEVLAGKKSGTERAGDVLQITNPIIGALVASQEKGFGHFVVIYGESLLFMGALQATGKATKWSVGKRPSRPGKKAVYSGFPSGHTTSAWSAASYIRVFPEDHKMLAVPMYLAAGFTGYSRVKSKKHTATQVVAAAIFSEAITMFNYKMQWSNEYRTTEIGCSEKSAMIRFSFKF